MAVTGYTKSGADTAIAAAVATKADLVGGKVPSSQIPASATTERVSVANAAARLALTSAAVQPGDLAVQVDDGTRWMLTDVDPSSSGNWFPLPLAGAGISHVNGQAGPDVVLGYADVGADAAGAAATALSSANGYTDGKIAAEVTRANGAYSKITDNGNGTFTST